MQSPFPETSRAHKNPQSFPTMGGRIAIGADAQVVHFDQSHNDSNTWSLPSTSQACGLTSLLSVKVNSW